MKTNNRYYFENSKIGINSDRLMTFQVAGSVLVLEIEGKDSLVFIHNKEDIETFLGYEEEK